MIDKPVMWHKERRNAASCHDTQRTEITVARAVSLIRDSMGGTTREALQLLTAATKDEPVLLFERKGYVWLLED